MATKYWVGDSGLWSNTAHWSLSSGGTGGVAIPTSSDDVIFDANSFTLASQTVTIGNGSFAICKSLDCSAVTNNPTFGSGTYTQFIIQGNVKFSANMTINIGSGLTIMQQNINGNATFDTQGVTVGANISLEVDTNKTIDISHDITCTYNCDLNINSSPTGAVINTNNYNITCGTFQIGSATVNLGTSTITCTGNQSLFTSGTVNGSNATLNITGSGTGQVWLNQTSGTLGTLNIQNGTQYTVVSTSSVSPLVTNFNVTVAPTEIDFKYTASFHTYTFGRFNVNGSSGNLIKIRSTVAASQPIISANTVSLSYIDVKDSVASGTASPFHDYPGGVDSGNNTNWLFVAAPISDNSLFFAGD